MPLNINTGGGILATTNFSPNEYELLADITIDSATTSVDISGLDIQQDQEIVLVSDVVNSGGSFSNYQGYVNGNTTSSNYYRQFLYADGSTYLASGRSNDAGYFDVANGNKVLTKIAIKLTNNGYSTWQSNMTSKYGANSVFIQNQYGTSTFTSTSITSLRIQASVSNAIGIGSRFQLYKVKGQVVQTWATT